MADMAALIAGIDGYRNYETNRALDLSNQAQNLRNQQQAKIMDLKTQLEGLQNNPYAKYNIWDPVSRRQQLLSDDQQLKIASKWASSIKNLSPDKKEQGYQQFLRAMPTLGIDVSDMPQGYDEAYINQLADLGIETETRYNNEQQNQRQERQLAATRENLERQIAANREARQEDFKNKLAAFDYEQGYKTRREREQRAETDDYIRSLNLDDDTTNRLLAKSRGIELPGAEKVPFKDLMNGLNYARQAGASPESLNTLSESYGYPDMNFESTDDFDKKMRNYQKVNEQFPDMSEPDKRRLAGFDTYSDSAYGKGLETKAQYSAQLPYLMERDNNQFGNNMAMEGLRQTGRVDLANLSAQNQLDNQQAMADYNANIAEQKAQADFNRQIQLLNYKNNLPTEEQKNITATAKALNIPEAQLYQIGLAKQQADIAQTSANTAKTQAEIPYAGLTESGKNFVYTQQNPDAANSPYFQKQTKDDKGEADLRKEFNQITKDYRVVGDSYMRILKAADKPSAAGDLSLIFNYMKMLDPNSVVRESEFSNAENARAWFDESGAPTFVRLAYQKAQNGQRLLKNQRDDFVAMAGKLMQAQKESFDNYAYEYGQIAQDRGYNPARVIIDPYKIKQQKGNDNDPLGIL